VTTKLAVHPVADLFPMLATDELSELAEDIKQRGLLHPIVLDMEGRILDGRNRHAACLLAEVEPQFVYYEGDDEDGYALAVNGQRRNMSKGQRASVGGLFLKNNPARTQEEIARAVGVSRSQLAYAVVVHTHAPDLAILVISGTKPLNEAYEEARKRKRDADSDDSKMVDLREKRPDLATQVVEETLTLAAAHGAMQADEQKRTDEQRDAQALLTRILDLTIPTSMSNGFIDSWAEHLGDVEVDLIDRTRQAGQVLHDLAERIKNK
jgi:ParB-like chromosome segregation protein Spo0J